jgi:hypothetical protein
MTDYDPGREAVISNGQRAMHLQKVNIAVEVSDLAATGSAYFDATAQVGPSADLDTLIPQLRDFTALIARLSESPAQTRPYRTLIPAELWRKGTAELEGLTHLDSDIASALETVARGDLDVERLQALATRLRKLSRVFAEISRQELDALTDQPSTVA